MTAENDYNTHLSGYNDAFDVNIELRSVYRKLCIKQ
jgi:hypothetical protein